MLGVTVQQDAESTATAVLNMQESSREANQTSSSNSEPAKKEPASVDERVWAGVSAHVTQVSPRLQAFIRTLHSGNEAPWDIRALETGGGGDCLFHSVAKGCEIMQHLFPEKFEDIRASCEGQLVNHVTLRQLVAVSVSEMSDLDVLNRLVSMRSQADAHLWHDHWDPRDLLMHNGLHLLADPTVDRINGIEYHEGNGLIAFRTTDGHDHVVAVEDFSVRVCNVQESFANELAIPGNNHWGTLTDIEMLAEKLNVGFLIFPVDKQGNPEDPRGWMYALHLHRGDFTHWMVVYCITNTHFQLAWIRCGLNASYRCLFTTDTLPSALRDHYNLNNAAAPVGSHAAP